ncbi:unnamed protein product [Bursaphelenchus xylophilus]|uniref:(pine wood nematode) hypothetical protein n=1 Tax=Bursaphelenchus xylophilus TaxID=6326 RepID=A0A1I7RXY1_BURXY|nr:unnamed protein product [Bursaphelenchus xylophilus]CAG9125245.1 unnamed protein product [Bursaphelenchus xylophilus]
MWLVSRWTRRDDNIKTEERKCCPPFLKPFSDERFSCSPAFDNSFSGYVANRAHDRIPLNDIPFMPTNCSDIKRRRFFSPTPLSEAERRFPIAFVRLVYKDYFLQEMMLSVQYQPQNTYCYSIDYKAGMQFRDRMLQMASCFPNVLVSAKQRIVTSFGHQMYAAQLDCLELIKDFEWKYVQLLQNDDIPLKTNLEMIKVLKLLNGANDVATRNFPFSRLPNASKWTLQNMNVFKDPARNVETLTGTSPTFNFSKSVVQVSLTKEFVEFLIDEVNIRELAQKIEDESYYGFDEVLYSSLNSMDAVNVPGGFTTKCLEEGIETGGVTRFSLWNKTGCQNIRHSMCMLEVDHLSWLIDLPHLYANKFVQGYDIRPPVCLLELLYNRTFLEKYRYRLDTNYYQNLPHVRYQRMKNIRGADVKELCAGGQNL